MFVVVMWSMVSAKSLRPDLLSAMLSPEMSRVGSFSFLRGVNWHVEKSV